jgi:hypothetical protein
LIVAVALSAALLAIRQIGHAGNWAQLAGQGILAGLAAVLIILAIGITADEREMYLWQPARKLFHPLARSAL